MTAIRVSISSPLNISFAYSELFDLEELVENTEGWEDMDDDEKWEVIKPGLLDMLFDRYIEVTYSEEET